MKNFLFRNPWIRTFLPLFLTTIASVIGNILVVEITNGSTIEWSAIPKRISFYILLATTSLIFIYQVFIYKFDNAMIKNFLTAKQYEAALRSEVLPESVIVVKKLIQEGKLDELEKATSTFKRLFGESVQ